MNEPEKLDYFQLGRFLQIVRRDSTLAKKNGTTLVFGAWVWHGVHTINNDLSSYGMSESSDPFADSSKILVFIHRTVDERWVGFALEELAKLQQQYERTGETTVL